MFAKVGGFTSVLDRGEEGISVISSGKERKRLLKRGEKAGDRIEERERKTKGWS